MNSPDRAFILSGKQEKNISILVPLKFVVMMKNKASFSGYPSVLMVLENEFPFDERVEKEAILLANSGYEVHLACFTRKGRNSVETYKGITIHRFPISGFYYKLSAACLIIPSYFKKWQRFIESIYKEYPFDILHVHDLPLAKPGYQIVKKTRGKLVCDQHEYYSDWIIRTSHYNHTLTGRIIKLFSNWKKYERKYLGKADLVITVEEPLREIYIKQVGIRPEKVITLPNTPLHSIFIETPVQKDIVNRYAEHFTLLYIGGIDILRGTDLAIRAVPSLKQTISNIKVLLIGPVYQQYKPLELASDLGVSDHVELIPWVNLTEIPSYIAGSRICFFTPPAEREEINRTITTKIYQYMAMGKPIIVSRAKMMKELVEKNNIGISVDETRMEEFVEAVLKIYHDPEYERLLSANALKTSERYFWEKTSVTLVKKYRELL